MSEEIDNKVKKEEEKKKTVRKPRTTSSGTAKKKSTTKKATSSKSTSTRTKKVDKTNEVKKRTYKKKIETEIKDENINSDNVVVKDENAKNVEVSLFKDEVKLEDKFVKKEKISFNLLEVLIIIGITIVFVSILTGFVVYNNYDKFNKNNNAISDKEYFEIENNLNTILNDYAGQVNKEELIDVAIGAMYNYLGDANTYYMDKDSNDTFQDTLSGEYEGIGVEITSTYNNDGTYKTYISKIFKDSAAERAGLKVGDVFVSLNGVDLKDKTSVYVADVIKNGAQVNNTITVNRDGKDITLDIKREHIYIDSVTSDVKDGVGYIKMDTFSLTTSSQVKKAIDSFDSSVKSLVIDLRDNGGGYTSSAYDIANLFVEKGKVIYQFKDKDNRITKYKADAGVYREFDKIAVLLNENSASSSEILALALKENCNAKMVGTKSFGKGSVQETKELSSGALVKYTIGYWLSPEGNLINEIGIYPEVEVLDVDKQIEKAIEAVK